MNGTQWIFDLINNASAPVKQLMADIDVTTTHTNLFNESLKETEESEAGIHGVSAAFSELGNEIIGAAAGFGLWTNAEAVFEGVIDTIKEAKQEIEEVTKRYDRFSLVLTNNFGSAEKAAEGMEMLEQVAKDTAQPIVELRDAFTQMQFKGIDIGKDKLEGLADIAIDAGKDIDQLMNAVEMASMGSTRALRQFGIRMEAVHGDLTHVTATFRGHKQVIDSSAESVLNYVISLGKIPGVAGTAAQFTEMYAGKTIELANRWDKFYEDMSHRVNGSLIDFTNFKIHAIDMLENSINWVIDHKDGFIEVFQDLGIALTALTIRWVALNAVELIGQGIAGLALLVTEGLTAAQWALNAALDANPLGIIIGLLALTVMNINHAWHSCENFRIAVFQVWETVKVVFSGLIDIGKLWFEAWYLNLKGIGEMMIGVFKIPFDHGAMFKQGIQDNIDSVKKMVEIPLKIKTIVDNVKGAQQLGLQEGIDSWNKTGNKGNETDLFGAPGSKDLFGKGNGAGGNTSDDKNSISGVTSGRSVVVQHVTIGDRATFISHDMTKTLKEVRKMWAEELTGAVRDFEVGISNG